MAKSNNNLKAVLQDTADAIRSKTGSASLIEPRDFADEISNINVGLDPVEVYTNTQTSAVIPSSVSAVRDYCFYQNTSLASVDFGDATTISSHCCDGCTYLTTITLSPNTMQVKEYAFYMCTHLTDISIPHTITRVEDYAFYYAGKRYSAGTHTFEFVGDVGVSTYIGDSAFYDSHLSNLQTTATNVGSNAFYNCTSLLTVNIKVNGALGENAFYNCTNVETFTLDSSSVITSFGSGVFYKLAYNKQNAVINDFDFRNSTFAKLTTNVWSNCKFNGNIYFPSTLALVGGNFLPSATGNWDLHFSSVPSATSSSYLRNDATGFTVKYIFLYTLLETAKTTTNWSNHLSQMLGYGTFQNGDTLPATSGTLTLTWYDDITLTNQVSTATADGDYYCTFA